MGILKQLTWIWDKARPLAIIVSAQNELLIFPFTVSRLKINQCLIHIHIPSSLQICLLLILLAAFWVSELKEIHHLF